MKKIIAFSFMAIMLFSLSACGKSNRSGEKTQPESESLRQSAEEQGEETPVAEGTQTLEETGDIEEMQTDETGSEAEQAAGGNALVVYFSCTGNTEAVAEEIGAQTGAEIIRIMPEVPYSDEDLNYRNDDCRANIEQNDDTARPAIAGEVPDISAYDTLYIGYPIWWGKLPKIMLTFLDTYDLSGKTIHPFCTSGGSGIATSVSEIEAQEPAAIVTEGLQVSGSASDDCKDRVAKWLEEKDK